MILRTYRTPRLLLSAILLATIPAATPLLAQSSMPGEPQPQTTKSGAAASAQGSQKFEPTAQPSSFGGTVVEDVVARVNDQIITRSDYDRALQQLQADGKQQNWSEAEMADRKRDLLRDLVDQQLLLSKGKELNLTGETELVKRLDEIRKQNHLDSMEELEKAASSQGVSYEDFKQNIRNGIITQEVIRNEVGRRIQLSHADVDRYYKEHASDFAQPESVRLSEILIPVTAGGDEAANLNAAKEKAESLSAKLKTGGNFEELAKANSAGSTAAQGGDLGEFRRGMLAKELEDQTFALDAGQVTAPIRTKQGYILLKVVQHTKGGPQDMKVVEPQVEEAVFMSHMQPALRAYLNQLREQAYLDTRPGYTDSAATSESVRPLYSAYVPPARKKKVKVERTRYRPSAHYRSKAKADAAAGSDKGASSATAVAANTPPEKPGKKEKVRFGQSPTKALPPAPAAAESAQAPAEPPAGAASAPGAPASVPDAGGTEVAGNQNPEIASTTGDIPTSAAAEKKTRFSDRARQPKPKKQKTPDQVENEKLEKVTPDETAARQTQGAPLGLSGNTANPKKQPKAKGEKTRYADAEKERKARENAAPPPPQPGTPSPLATPGTVPAAAPAAPPAAPSDGQAAPANNPPAENQPAPGTPPQPGSTQQQ